MRGEVMRALVAQAGGQEEFDKRVAVVLGTVTLAYTENDPADSKSGTEYALGRRQGRRDVALEVARVLLGADTTEQVEEFIRQLPPPPSSLRRKP